MRDSIEKEKAARVTGSKFRLDCLPFIFSGEELDILEKRGRIMQALAEGREFPVTEEEKSFLRVCRGQAEPLTPMEKAWTKYLHRHQLEASLFQAEEIYSEYIRWHKR